MYIYIYIYIIKIHIYVVVHQVVIWIIARACHPIYAHSAHNKRLSCSYRIAHQGCLLLTVIFIPRACVCVRVCVCVCRLFLSYRQSSGKRQQQHSTALIPPLPTRGRRLTIVTTASARWRIEAQASSCGRADRVHL